ncbi:MAG TPA: formyl-CoA transferase, partial [Hyphomonadaceae bacterium]|nr:formyl-CoA transferase [Hyphomonadaceae bacterium]
GTMAKLGLDYESLKADHPGLIYCSLKGFLSGPYENRVALDEVTQMMGGLAYMTGLPDRPLRAGSSVIDITGGMFGVIAILSALHRRRETGEGSHVTSALFETTAFLVGQHMAQFGVTGSPAAPMPARISAWAVYDVFDVRDGEKVFVGVVSDGQWAKFCEAFGLAEWAGDESLAQNNERVARRDEIMPVLRALFETYSKDDLMVILEEVGLPFAPISKPEDLFDDPHLNAKGGLLDLELPDGTPVKLPALPVEMDGARPGLRLNPPKVGEHTTELLDGLGLSSKDIQCLAASGVI